VQATLLKAHYHVVRALLIRESAGHLVEIALPFVQRARHLVQSEPPGCSKLYVLERICSNWLRICSDRPLPDKIENIN